MSGRGKKDKFTELGTGCVYSVCIHAFHQMKAWLRFVDVRNNALSMPRFPLCISPPKCFTILLIAGTPYLSAFIALSLKAACRDRQQHCCAGVSLESALR